MKKITLLFLILPFFGLGQVQIGQDIDGQDYSDLAGRAISISLDGSIIAVGSPGSLGDNIGGNLAGQVRVFENISGVWTQIGQDINGEAAVDRSGENLSLSADGNIIAIGASENDGNGFNSGHVRVYENISGVWTQIGQDIDGVGSNDMFGRSIDISSDGSILAVGGGAIINGSKGYVNIYENINGTWSQIGSSIIGEGIGDNSGSSFDGGSISLSPDGSTIIIGSETNNGNGDDAGHVRVYENISGVWTQKGQDIDGDGDFYRFGGRVALSASNTFFAAASTGNTETTFSLGYVKVYQYTGNTWVQVGQTLAGEDNFNKFGKSLSLSLDGSILIASAPGFNSSIGKTYVYKNINDSWVELGSILGDYTFELSGNSIDISENMSILAIGSPASGGNSNIPNGRARVFNIDDLLLSIPAFEEVIEDIAGNINNISITASQLNSISGVSGAIDGVNYTTALDNGTYADENSPTALEIQFIIDLVNASLGLEENSLFNFKLYPNPAKTQFTIQLDPSVQLDKISIYNSLGQEVLTSKAYTVDTSKLSSGSYVVEVTTNQGKSTKQLIKN
ncbi:T9SS type A sorting domain-containing protein [uncultured Psychroserpens sp.]|uniref:T9SS type A sorting domain-containing protein n=1 Tax=uncultured Psychroserpens sp. TaxID=255436 RepID=UPI00261D841F|nr:T9SS type A sorting domain-containing protein [uncultured Psychroserpens sp.]